MARQSSPESIAACYSITGLLTNSDRSFEKDLAEVIGQKQDEGNRLPGASWLPSPAFARSLGIGTASAGGNLAFETNGLAAVAEAARPRLLLEALGAQRLEVTGTGSVGLPSWIAGSGGWLSEGGSPAPSGSSVRTVTCSGRMAGARLGVSRKLLLQAQDIEQALLAELTNAVANTIEAGLLGGDGSSNQPIGLVNTAGKSAKTFAATVPSHAELCDMLELFAAADGDLARAVWMLTPATAAALLKAEISGGSGQTVAMIGGEPRTPLLVGIPAHVSRNVPAGQVILTDPTMLRIVYWGAPQLVVDRVSGGKSLSGAAELCVFNLVDIGVLTPAHIVVGSA